MVMSLSSLKIWVTSSIRGLDLLPYFFDPYTSFGDTSRSGLFSKSPSSVITFLLCMLPRRASSASLNSGNEARLYLASFRTHFISSALCSSNCNVWHSCVNPSLSRLPQLFRSWLLKTFSSCSSYGSMFGGLFRAGRSGCGLNCGGTFIGIGWGFSIWVRENDYGRRTRLATGWRNTNTIFAIKTLAKVCQIFRTTILTCLNLNGVWTDAPSSWIYAVPFNVPLTQTNIYNLLGPFFLRDRSLTAPFQFWMVSIRTKSHLPKT